MPIDSSIYQNIQVQPTYNALDQYAKRQQLEHVVGQNDLAKLLMQEKQREIQDNAELRDLTRQTGGDTNKLMQALYGAGRYKEGMALGKDLRTQQKEAADLNKTNAELAHKNLEITGQVFGHVRANPTLDNAMAAISHLESLNVIPKDRAEQMRQQVNADPTQIQGLADSAFRSALSAKDQLPKNQTTNLQNKQVYQLVDPLTGKVTQTGSDVIGQSADNEATNETTKRGQNMTDARMREANKIANEGKVATTSTTLRKEFDDLPEVKNYKQAVPAYRAVEDAATRNTTASDINLVYGIAKLYDPNSVVREGEYATIANSPNIPEKIKGYAQYLTNGGRLTENVKNDILTEARGRMGSFEKSYEGARGNYESIASRSGAEPTLLFPSSYQSVVQKPTGKAQPKGSSLSGADSQAAEWAKANPNDPRAAAINKRLGL